MARAGMALLEREEISRGLVEDPMMTWTELARRVGRHPATVAREVARHGGRHRYRRRWLMLARCGHGDVAGPVGCSRTPYCVSGSPTSCGPGSRRPRRDTRADPCHAASFDHLGPRLGDGPLGRPRCHVRSRRLVLRPPQTLATRPQRTHQPTDPMVAPTRPRSRHQRRG